MFEGRNISDITIGMKASVSNVITDEKIRAFAEISGDYNPIHLDEDYAKNSKFGKRIAHGSMIASYFSTLFAMDLPGEGSIYVSQNTKFKKPVFLGDTLLVEIEVIDIDAERKRIYFTTTCFVRNTEVLTGTAEIYLP